MAEYHALISRAVVGADSNEARRSAYNRARTLQLAQLRQLEPPLTDTEIKREQFALEQAIQVVEREAASGSGTLPKAKIFISYSRKDMSFANRLEAALKARGFEPLIDRTEIYAFEDWWKRIETLIGRADTVVFVLSPDAVASNVALKEVAHAASLNKRFAPIVCRRTDDSVVPDTLRRLNFIFFDDPAHFDASADQLAEALNTNIGWVRQHTEFGEAARRWGVSSRKSGFLLRSPALEDAERWIASRPPEAPTPTEETKAFITESRRGATRRRNILTGSLGAGLIFSIALAGAAYWQREVAVAQERIAQEQRKLAEEQRDAAQMATAHAVDERNRADAALLDAFSVANVIVADVAIDVSRIPGADPKLIHDLINEALDLQDRLSNAKFTGLEIKQAQAGTINAAANALLNIGDAKDALEQALKSNAIWNDIISQKPDVPEFISGLAANLQLIGDAKRRNGDHSGAEKAYEESLTLLRKLVSKKDATNEHRRQLAFILLRVSGARQQLQDYVGARNAMTESLLLFCALAQNKSNIEAQQDLKSVLKFVNAPDASASICLNGSVQ